MTSMIGQSVDDYKYKFKKCHKAVNLNHRSVIKVKNDIVKVDPQFKFQRLVTIGEHTQDLQVYFSISYVVTHPLYLNRQGYHSKQTKPVWQMHCGKKYSRWQYYHLTIQYTMF